MRHQWKTKCQLKVWWKWSKEIKMTHKARFFVKRKIWFEKKFVIFVWELTKELIPSSITIFKQRIADGRVVPHKMDKKKPTDERRCEEHHRGTKKCWSIWVNGITRQNSMRNLSQVHVSWTHTQRYCGSILTSANEEVQKTKTRMPFITYTSGRRQPPKSRPAIACKWTWQKTRCTRSWQKPRTLWKVTRRKSYRTIFERCRDDTYRQRMTEQKLNEYDFRRRDEEAKIDRIHYTNGSEQQRYETHFSWSEIVELMLEVLGITVNTLTFKKHWKNCDVSETPIHLQPNRSNHRSSNHCNSTCTLHRGMGGIRTVGITNHGVMISGSHRQALIRRAWVRMSDDFSRSPRTKTSEDKRSHPLGKRGDNLLRFFSVSWFSAGGEYRKNPSSAFVHSARLHALTHTPRDVLWHSTFVVLERKLCHRHIDDRIHMHFHDNPTDTQHQSALTHEVSLPCTTPLRTFEELRGVLSAIKPNYFHPQVVSPTCTSNFYVSISNDTVRNSATSSETEDVATTLPAKAYFWVLELGAIHGDILYRIEVCQQTKFPTFFGGEKNGKQCQRILSSSGKTSTSWESKKFPRRQFPKWAFLKTWKKRRTWVRPKTNEFIFTNSQ